jgi:G3E family GTPase
MDRLKDSHEAEEQVAFADVILLNKTDLVSPDELKAVEAKIREINKYAKVFHTTKSQIDLDKILDRGAFDLQRILEVEPEFLHDHHHHHEHDSEITSTSVTIDGPVNPERFRMWISGVLREKGQDILRSKGVLAVDGEDRRLVFQGVHMLMDSNFGQPWKPGDKRSSKLVFIGRNLDCGALERGFKACAQTR